MLDRGLFGYSVWLALRNIRRNIVLSLLMVAAIGIGIGASMSMVTVNYRFQANPIPEKSDVLHYIRLDSGDPNGQNDAPPAQLTYLDATALLRAGRAYREAAMSMARMAVIPPDREQRPFFAEARAPTADFFPMFEAPFEFGGGWTAAEDDGAEQVVVLSAPINDRIFGGVDSVGRTLTLANGDYRVVGVLAEWDLSLRFWDAAVGGGPGVQIEDVFVPWSLIVANALQRQGNTNCWKPFDGSSLTGFLNSECVWIQYWAELRTEAERSDYHAFLDAYVTEQKALGRFPRPLDNRVTDVMDFLAEEGGVPNEARVLLGLSILFLAVCLINTLGMLLAKFLGKASEIGVRRALGASRVRLMQQYLIEAAIIGVAGGLLGIVLTWLGLKGIDGLIMEDLGNFLAIDWKMALTAVGLAIVATLITSIYPTWRACSVQPSVYLKSN